MATATIVEAREGPTVPAVYRVAAREQDAVDTWTLVLEPVDRRGTGVAPGQFMMATVFGVGEVPISVSGPPNRPGPVVLTVRGVGAVTRAVCASEPGATLGLRGPFGNEWPVDGAVGGDVVVVAGGIGLAPLRPAVLRVLERRGEYGNVSVLYGARTPGDLLYTGQLAEWTGVANVATTVDTAGAGWRGRVGVVTKLLASARFEPAATAAFVCGPEVMMRFAAQGLLDAGVPAARIYVSVERHMDCGIGLCGHCQLGPTLICRDGPVYTWEQVAPWLEVREL
jgi:NAD(P)H-flavin reductase